MLKLFKRLANSNYKYSHYNYLILIASCIWFLKKAGGWIVGRRIMLPAQWLVKADNKKILLERLQETKNNGPLKIKYEWVKTSDYSILDTAEIYHEETNLLSPHVIVFCGNFYSYDVMIPTLKKMAEENKWKVIVFDYPNVRNSTGLVLSQNVLINAGIAQVNRLLQSGVKAENITLYGLSLGGGIASLVASYFHQLKSPEKVYLLNDRSFSSTGRMSMNWYGVTLGQYLLSPILYFINWDINAGKAFNKIPDTHKLLFVAEHDTVIPYFDASLYQTIKPGLKTRLSNVEHLYKSYTKSIKVANAHEFESFDELHRAPLSKLKDKHGNSMNDTAKLFIQRQLTAEKFVEIRKEYLDKRKETSVLRV